MTVNKSSYTIAVIPGDGIGPEIVDAACTILTTVAEMSDFGVNLVRYEAGAGAYQTYGDPLPPETFPLQDISPDTFENVQHVQFVPNISTTSIFFNNLRVIILAAVFSIITFGSLTLALTLVNLGLVSFIIAQIIMLGHDPWLFVATFILPHGIFEIPAILIGMTFALRIGAALISPPEQLDLGQSLLLTLANYAKILIFVIIPLLFVAAYIEANITPQIVLYVYGG